MSGKVCLLSPTSTQVLKASRWGTGWYLTGIVTGGQENAGMEEVGGKFPVTHYRAGKDTTSQSQKTQFRLAQSPRICEQVGVCVWVCECVRELRQSLRMSVRYEHKSVLGRSFRRLDFLLRMRKLLSSPEVLGEHRESPSVCSVSRVVVDNRLLGGAWDRLGLALSECTVSSV